jgi:hypothetical protein
MKPDDYRNILPRYKGTAWIEAKLPQEPQPWLPGKRPNHIHQAKRLENLSRIYSEQSWRWPKRTLFFLSDLHADTDAFIASLVASGGIHKTGPRDKDFKLTKAGKRACFLIGGDCLDKGPSNLRLLKSIHRLQKAGADVCRLAGNHDVRMRLGIESADQPRDPSTDHFFIRMGPKVIPFLNEIAQQYLQDRRALRGIPTTRECRRILYPPKTWFRDFPKLATWVMRDEAIDREMDRLRKKMESFEENCEKAGLNLREVYAAAKKWQELFLHPKGKYAWFYRDMKLVHREGSFLFLHAGLDDRMARAFHDDGLNSMNRLFHKQIAGDMFHFYYGPVANSIRTKYRNVDMPLTARGVKLVKDKGIYAIVHGHEHLSGGQSIILRKGLINFACDASIDRSTRRREGLKGAGAAVTIFRPERAVIGISTDHPYMKVFQPDTLN